MRIALFSLITATFLCAAGTGQDAKKKDEKPPDKSGTTKEISEVAGKTLDEWIELIHTTDPSKREQAMRTILAFGPEKAQQAVPAIIAELKKHNKSGVRVDLSVRISGAVALGTILGAVKEPDKEPNVTRIKDAVGLLKRLCDDPQVIARTRAAQSLAMLARLGAPACEAKNEIIHVAKDLDTWEARHAGLETLRLFTLVEKGPPTPIVLQVYYNALKDKSMLVRIAAVKALVQFPIAPGGQAMLLSKLKESASKDKEPAVKIWAHLAIMTVNQNAATADLISIAKLIEDTDPNVRLQAAQALGMIGPKAQQTAGYLQAALYDSEPTIVVAAIIALVRMDAKTAIPALRKLAADKTTNETVKQAASRGIDELEGRNKKMDKGKEKEKASADK
jgi:HEAT repeat protein